VASGEVAKGITVHGNLGTLRVREPKFNALTWNLAGEWAAGGGVETVASAGPAPGRATPAATGVSTPPSHA
jgi:hypothetical protein